MRRRSLHFKSKGGGYLLDTYTGAAAAYSLRQLKTGVTDVVEVRRDNDDTVSDFTPTEITDGTLATWVGANDGFVTVWYDQSGNGNDASNSNKIYQPQIISSGSLITHNSLPYVEQKDDSYLVASELNSNVDIGDATIMGVYYKSVFANNNSYDKYNRVYAFGNRSVDKIDNITHWVIALDNSLRFDGAYQVGTITSIQEDHIRTSLKDASVYSDWINGSNNVNAASISDNGIIDDFYINTGDQASTVENQLAEVIVWLSDNTSNRVAIETDMNTYYSIY